MKIGGGGGVFFLGMLCIYRFDYVHSVFCCLQYRETVVGGYLASWWVGQKKCNRCQKENNLKIYYSNQKSLFILIKSNVKTSQRFSFKPTSAGQIDRSRTSTQI